MYVQAIIAQNVIYSAKTAVAEYNYTYKKAFGAVLTRLPQGSFFQLLKFMTGIVHCNPHILYTIIH